MFSRRCNNIQVKFNGNVYANNTKSTITNETAPVLTVKFGNGQGQQAKFQSVSGNIIKYKCNPKADDIGDLKIVSYMGTVYSQYGTALEIMSAKELVGYKLTAIELKMSNLNAQNAYKYYGKKVDYTAGGLSYRIFYIDFEDPDGDRIGKYGDPVGTIYLKADYDSTVTANIKNNCDSYNSTSVTKVQSMNPLWASNYSELSQRTNNLEWNTNEKASAYLCDTVKWGVYASDIKYGENNVNYAIAGPSLEMYIDSYNQSGLNNTKLEYIVTSYKDMTKYKYGYLLKNEDGTLMNVFGSWDYTLKSNIMYGKRSICISFSSYYGQ